MAETLSAEQIRQMDGPALTALAVQWGLAPDTIRPDEEDPALYRIRCYFPEAEGYDWGWWEPHVNLAQADAVFRGLRARGWATRNTYDPAERHGSASVLQAEADEVLVSVGYCLAEEALALLRCAVLAVASEQGVQHGG